MAKLTMLNGRMVVTAETQAEEKRLSELAYAGASVSVTKAKAKKADDE